MNHRIKLYITFSFLLLIIISCSKDNLSLNFDTSYFPLGIGQSTQFDIERTDYSLSSSPKITSLTTLQIISASFKDINDQLVFETTHFVQTNNSEWSLDYTNTAWRTLDKAMSQENGQTVINMAFPVANDVSWNGNLFNANGKEMFRMINVGKPYQTETTLFPNTVTIIRQDDSTLLSRNRYIEIYAKDVGLIRKEKIFLQYCNTPDCVGKGIINSGWTEFSSIKND